MTLDARKPVIGWQAQDDKLNVFALGEIHSYEQQEAKQSIMLAYQQVKIGTQLAGDHGLRIIKFLKTWLIRDISKIVSAT